MPKIAIVRLTENGHFMEPCWWRAARKLGLDLTDSMIEAHIIISKQAIILRLGDRVFNHWHDLVVNIADKQQLYLTSREHPDLAALLPPTQVLAESRVLDETKRYVLKKKWVQNGNGLFFGTGAEATTELARDPTYDVACELIPPSLSATGNAISAYLQWSSSARFVCSFTSIS